MRSSSGRRHGSGSRPHVRRAAAGLAAGPADASCGPANARGCSPQGGRAAPASPCYSPRVRLSRLPAKGGHHHAAVADVAVGVRGSQARARHARLGAVQRLRVQGGKEMLAHGRLINGSVRGWRGQVGRCLFLFLHCLCVDGHHHTHMYAAAPGTGACTKPTPHLHACGLVLSEVQPRRQRQLDDLGAAGRRAGRRRKRLGSAARERGSCSTRAARKRSVTAHQSCQQQQAAPCVPVAPAACAPGHPLCRSGFPALLWRRRAAQHGKGVQLGYVPSVGSAAGCGVRRHGMQW